MIYKYISNNDMDEILLPRNGKTWREVINDVIKNETIKQGNEYQPPISYSSHGAEFLEELRDGWSPDIPKYMSMLQNVFRSDQDRAYKKQLLDTEINLASSTHFPLRCFGNNSLSCTSYPTQWLDRSIAIMAHFRQACKYKECHGYKDTIIWNHKETMINTVNAVLTLIGLI